MRVRISLILSLVIVVLANIPLKAEMLAYEPTWVSDEYVEYAEQYAEEYNISKYLIIAIIEHESSGKKNATAGNCVGLMQVNKVYQNQRMKDLGHTDIYDPQTNIHVGCDMLAELFEKYDGETWFVLMAYNGGEGYADRMIAKDKVSNYAISILNRADYLTRLAEAKG